MRPKWKKKRMRRLKRKRRKMRQRSNLPTMHLGLLESLKQRFLLPSCLYKLEIHGQQLQHPQELKDELLVTRPFSKGLCIGFHLLNHDLSCSGNALPAAERSVQQASEDVKVVGELSPRALRGHWSAGRSLGDGRAICELGLLQRRARPVGGASSQGSGVGSGGGVPAVSDGCRAVGRLLALQRAAHGRAP
eukprot:SM000212S06885  [mRNA]  locus=s212:50840:53231:+ [translate_table: standard]